MSCITKIQFNLELRLPFEDWDIRAVFVLLFAYVVFSVTL